MLTDYSEEKSSLEIAASHTVTTGIPTKVILANQEEPVFLITQQAYNYLLKSMKEDEAWDLGFLGCSEEHVVPKEVNPKLKQLILQSKEK